MCYILWYIWCEWWCKLRQCVETAVGSYDAFQTKYKKQTGTYYHATTTWHFLQWQKHTNVLYLMSNLQGGTEDLKIAIGFVKLKFVKFLLMQWLLKKEWLPAQHSMSWDVLHGFILLPSKSTVIMLLSSVLTYWWYVYHVQHLLACFC